MEGFEIFCPGHLTKKGILVPQEKYPAKDNSENKSYRFTKGDLSGIHDVGFNDKGTSFLF